LCRKQQLTFPPAASPGAGPHRLRDPGGAAAPASHAEGLRWSRPLCQAEQPDPGCCEALPAGPDPALGVVIRERRWLRPEDVPRLAPSLPRQRPADEGPVPHRARRRCPLSPALLWGQGHMPLGLPCSSSPRGPLTLPRAGQDQPTSALPGPGPTGRGRRPSASSPGFFQGVSQLPTPPGHNPEPRRLERDGLWTVCCPYLGPRSGPGPASGSAMCRHLRHRHRSRAGLWPRRGEEPALSCRVRSRTLPRPHSPPAVARSRRGLTAVGARGPHPAALARRRGASAELRCTPGPRPSPQRGAGRRAERRSPAQPRSPRGDAECYK